MSSNLTVHLARITGTPSQTCWSQTYTFFPEEEEKKEKRGVLLACLSFYGQNGGVEMVAMGREILSRLQEEFYGQLEEQAFLKLAAVVEKVCQEFSGEEQKLEIVAGCLLGEVLYLAAKGGGQVWVKREGVFQKVLDGEETLEKASGFLKKDDLLILGTASFFKLLTPGILKAALETGEPSEAVEALAPLVGGQEDSSAIAAVIGKVERPEPVEEEEIVAEEPAPPKEEKMFPQKKPPSFFTQGFSKMKSLFPERVYLRSSETFLEEKKKKRVVFTIAILLILLLGVSLFFGTQKKAAKEKQEKYDRLYQETLSLLETGKALVSLNPSQARQELLVARDKLSELESLQVEEEKTKNLKSQTEEALRLVIKEKEMTEVPVFFDLGILAAEAKGERLALSGEHLLVLDKGKNRLFSVEIGQKSGKILAGGETLAGASLVAAYADLAYVFADQGIYEVDFAGKKGKIVIAKDDAWGEIGALASYAGNLYLLDKTGKIWRYQRAETGFGSRQNWFGEGVSPDFSQAQAMAIDGSVWVLTQGSKVFKFTLGVLDAFGISGLEKPFSSAVALDTNAASRNLYLLDKGNGRIVVLGKSGEYQFQYLWEGLKESQDLVVSEEKGEIFILKGEKIYALALE